MLEYIITVCMYHVAMEPAGEVHVVNCDKTHLGQGRFVCTYIPVQGLKMDKNTSLDLRLPAERLFVQKYLVGCHHHVRTCMVDIHVH